MTKRFFIEGINVCKKRSFQPIEKIIPKFLLSPKKDFEKPYSILLKLCKENRVQSKIFDVFFSIEFHFETKKVVLLQDFVHLHIAICPHIYSTYNVTISIVERNIIFYFRSLYEPCKSIGFTRFPYEIYLNRWRKRIKNLSISSRECENLNSIM